MLSGKQKRYLRGLGNELNPIVMVGKEGFSPNLLRQLDEALEARELVKGRVQSNCPLAVEEAAALLAGESGAELVQVIGRNFLLYRRALKDPAIELPYKEKP